MTARKRLRLRDGSLLTASDDDPCGVERELVKVLLECLGEVVSSGELSGQRTRQCRATILAVETMMRAGSEV